MKDENFLRLNKLRHRAGNFTFQVDDFSVAESEYLCVVGPTGSGKTTLLEVIAGIRNPEEGSIRYGGFDVTRAAPEERFIGFAYQDSLLLPFLRVEENILFGARSGKRKITPEIRARAKLLMERMGIVHTKDRYPRNLSGGERQRVSLARALLLRPPLLLLDEPLSSLDARRRGSLRDFLKAEQAEEGTTVVHVTHEWREVAQLANRVVIMNGGRLVGQGKPEAFLNDFEEGNFIKSEFISAR